MEEDQRRLEALCAHVETHGIGDLLPFLSVDETMFIEARGSVRKYFEKARGYTKRNDPREILPYPEWFKEVSAQERNYVIHIRNGYLNQVRALPRRGKERAARLKDIKQRYLKELRSILKNIQKQAIRDEGFERVYASRYRGTAPTANAIGGALFGTNEHKWMALLEADFDMWVECL
jgi:hypothetical protein